MWFNIDTRGHKKAKKWQNIAVGPEDPPGYLPGSKNPGDKGLKIKYGCQGAQTWPTRSGKVSTPRFLGVPVKFH